MNFMRNLILWIKVILIRLPKEMWYQIEQLYYDEKLKKN
jgi:hypothetical protein